MKKLLMILFAVSFGIMAGCSSTNESKEEAKPVEQPNKVADETPQKLEEQTTDAKVAVADVQQVDANAPTEPGEGEKCSWCNMEVYHKDHEMGMYTGQVVTADGKHLFTDDVGCTLNQVRVLKEKPVAAYVRDYNTLEWVPVEQAAVVKATIKTPMKMGFALFGSEDAAKKFVEENGTLQPELSSMDEVDKIALERYKKKMEKMKQSQEKSDGTMKENMGNMEDMEEKMDDHMSK